MKELIDFNLILDNLPHAIFLKDENSVYLYCNNSFADMLEKSKEEIIGKTDHDLFSKETADKYKKTDKHILDQNNFVYIEEKYLLDEVERIVQLTKDVLKTSQGKNIILGIACDITKHKDTETNLLKIKESLEKAQRVAQIGNWDWNIVTGELWWSDEIYRIFGLKPQEFAATYEAFLNTIHPNDRDKVIAAVNKSIDGDIEYNIEHRIVLPDETIRFVNEQGHIERDKNNRAIRMLGTVNDITKHKEAEKKQLLASKIIDNSIESILITDADQKIIEVNSAFTKVTGFTRDEVIGKTPTILKSGWHDKKFYKEMWDSIENTGSWEGEIWDRKKNGEVYVNLLAVSAILDDDKKVTNYVALSNDITEKKEWEKQIHSLAYYDVLTSLPNKTLFHDRVNQRISSAKNHDEQLAILFLDLDNFKFINDTMGHHSGDILLKSVAQRLKTLLSEDDLIARLGGDEFTILLEHNPNMNKTTDIAQKIINIFSEPFVIEKKDIYTGASIGISVYPDDGTDYDTLLKNADTAMYQTKEAGRNGYKFYTEEMNKQNFERLLLNNNLRNAIKNNELFLLYQPKILLKNGSVSGMEALIRWRHPDLGVVSPLKFIPVAEETGLIKEIGEWVLETASLQTKKWHENGFKDLVVSVNVSTKQLQDKNYVQSVKSVIKKTGIAPDMLELEITETSIMENVQTSLSKLKKITDLGVSISIDDFGTGYSSMSHLKKLPAKILKIDRSFIKDSHTDKGDKKIIRAIIALAASLGMETIAEGADKIEHIDILKELGCDKVQGFIYAQPLEPEEFVQFLLKNR